mmetsp:Transcript_153657/g.492543  ORF Transcript_153657/g.492543 Transcript_153657/m.492543 type:complete len:247 (+) Transcript_153657:5-745(+)
MHACTQGWRRPSEPRGLARSTRGERAGDRSISSWQSRAAHPRPPAPPPRRRRPPARRRVGWVGRRLCAESAYARPQRPSATPQREAPSCPPSAPAAPARWARTARSRQHKGWRRRCRRPTPAGCRCRGAAAVTPRRHRPRGAVARPRGPRTWPHARTGKGTSSAACSAPARARRPGAGPPPRGASPRRGPGAGPWRPRRAAAARRDRHRAPRTGPRRPPGCTGAPRRQPAPPRPAPAATPAAACEP